MPYGTIKVDTITFTAGGADTSVSISGLVQNPTFTGNITTTGTVTAATVVGTTTVSGATVTGTQAQFTVITGGTAGFTTITGTTVTGTTANFATVSGTTVTGNAGSFTTVTGGVATITSGVFATGAEALPSISFSSDPNTGIYSPGADQVAISTNGTGKIFVGSTGTVNFTGGGTAGSTQAVSFNGSAPINSLVIDSSGRLGVGTSSPSNTAGFSQQLEVAGNLPCVSISNTGTGANKYSLGVNSVGAFGIWDNTASAFRMYINSSGQVGLGTSSPGSTLHVVGQTQSVYNASYSDTANYGFAFKNSTTTAKQLWGGYDGTADAGFIQSTHTGVAHKPLLINPNGGDVGIGTTDIPSDTNLAVLGNYQSGFYRNVTSGNRGYFINIGAKTSTGFADAANVFGGLDSGDSTGYLSFGTRTAGAVTEKARLTSAGQFLVGTSTARSNLYNSTFTSPFQVEGTSYNTTGGLFVCNANDATTASILNLAKTRGTSVGSNTVVQSGDLLGVVDFLGSDGSELVEAAFIGAYVDGTPGSNDMPGRLVFSTCSDGSASPTERVRIASTGRITIEANSTTGGIYVNNWSTGAGNSTVKYSSTTGQLTYDTSSRLVKTDIEDCPYGLEQIKLLRPRQYFRVDDQRSEIGFVADEVASVMPEFVPVGPKSIITKNEDDTEEIPLAVNYDKITAVLTKALQQALAKIETLEAKVAALEAA